jgi:hypothetical protein
MAEREQKYTYYSPRLDKRVPFQAIKICDRRRSRLYGITEFHAKMKKYGFTAGQADTVYAEFVTGALLVEIKLELYIETEYARYYKYLPSEKYKQRHFEARGTFTVPPGIDPDGQKVYDMIEKIFDVDVMAGTLGIAVDDNWEIDWVSGAEEKGKTDSFERNVQVVVVDKLRPSLGPYRVNVPMNEADFGEPKPEE